MSLMVRRGCLYLSLIVASFWLAGCKETTGVIDLPGGFDENYSLVFTDTMSVKTSTVLLDSIPTSSYTTGPVLLGRYSDPELGDIEARPYLQLNLITATVDANAKYDSITLVMPYTKYYYGDTTQLETYEVRRLNEDMFASTIPSFWKSVSQYSYFNLQTSNGYEIPSIANNRTFDVYNDVIGTATIRPLPTGTKPITIRLNDDLGMEFFDKLQNYAAEFKSDPTYSANHNFQEYFKGIEVRSTGLGSILGFKTSGSGFKVQVHYSLIDVSGTLKNLTVDFPVIPGASYYHTHISADRSATGLANLSTANKILSSRVTSDQSYIESGVGLAARLSLPSLYNVKYLDGFSQISNARLIIEPVGGTYGDNELFLPDVLMLFYTNKSNAPVTPVLRSNGAPLVAGLSYNNTGNVATPQYVFDLTSYAQAIVKSAVEQDIPFLVTTSVSSANANIYFSTSRMVIGGEQSPYKVRLEVRYLKSLLN